MHLLLLNGSPKGERGNSNHLLKLFMEGVNETPGHTHESVNLVEVREHARFMELFARADGVIWAMPVYADMMPAIDKLFMERLEPLCGRQGNPALGFIVQGGFPEAMQMRALEAYLEKLSRRLGCRYLGTALRGSGETLRVMPRFMIKGFIEGAIRLGREFGRTGEFDADIILRFARYETMSPFRLLQRMALIEPLLKLLMWHPDMKRNGVYAQRFARPYADPPEGW